MSQQTIIPEFFLFMIFTLIVSSFPIANSLTLELVRRDYFDFDLFPKNLSKAEKNQIFSKLSHSRATRLARQLPNVSKSLNGSVIIDTIRPTMKQFLDSSFAVSVDIGSKPYRTYVIFDTGSYDLWVQCQGCHDCFKIKNGAFKENTSTSYRKIRFDDPLCLPRIRVGDDCKFEHKYAMGQVEGVRSLENLHFPSTEGRVVTIPNISIGCVKHEVGIKFGRNAGPSNVISGILGLALGPMNGNTFMDVSRNLTKMKFAYCLPPWTASKSKKVMLTFGDDVPRLSPSAQTTPMKTPLFYLNVTDISVGGTRLNLDPSLFRVQRDLKGGFMIDTGCTKTYLVAEAYERVKEAMAAILDKHAKPVKPQPGLRYNLCYKWPLKIKNPPSVTFHMQNANLEVRFGDIFVKEKISSFKKLACMSISPARENRRSILGSRSQADYQFVYDLERKALSFDRVQC